MVLTYDLYEDRQIDDVTIHNFLLFYYIKEIDSMFLLVRLIIHHRWRQNVVRKSVTVFGLSTFWRHPSSIPEQNQRNGFHHGCHAENVTWHAKERLQRRTSVKHATSENQFMFEKPLSLSKWSYLVLTSWFINHKS